MKKSDLKNGMIVVNRCNEIGLVLKSVNTKRGEMDIIKYDNDFEYMKSFSDDLLREGLNGYDIMKVYTFTKWGCPFDLKEELHLAELIWERKQEIDWTKVPRGTMIKIKDCKDEEWEERELIAYLGDDINATHKFICKSKINKGQYYHWKYATIDNPKQEWLK